MLCYNVFRSSYLGAVREPPLHRPTGSSSFVEPVATGMTGSKPSTSGPRIRFANRPYAALAPLAPVCLVDMRRAPRPINAAAGAIRNQPRSGSAPIIARNRVPTAVCANGELSRFRSASTLSPRMPTTAARPNSTAITPKAETANATTRNRGSPKDCRPMKTPTTTTEAPAPTTNDLSGEEATVAWTAMCRPPNMPRMLRNRHNDATTPPTKSSITIAITPPHQQAVDKNQGSKSLQVNRPPLCTIPLPRREPAGLSRLYPRRAG